VSGEGDPPPLRWLVADSRAVNSIENSDDGLKVTTKLEAADLERVRKVAESLIETKFAEAVAESEHPADYFVNEAVTNTGALVLDLAPERQQLWEAERQLALEKRATRVRGLSSIAVLALTAIVGATTIVLDLSFWFTAVLVVLMGVAAFAAGYWGAGSPTPTHFLRAAARTS
jgi:hypothetical protein